MNTLNIVGSSYCSSTSSDSTSGVARTLLTMQKSAGVIGTELAKALRSDSNSSTPSRATASLGTVDRDTEGSAFSRNLHRLATNLNDYVLSGSSGIEVQERDFVADYITRAFLSQSEVLRIRQPNITELPDCLGLLQNVKVLDLSGCTSLEKLPDVLDSFPGLEILNLQGCAALTALPKSVMGMRWFTTLFIKGTSINLSNPTNAKVVKHGRTS